jgi:stage II sporulation protein D
MQGQVPRKSTGFESCKALAWIDAPSHEPHAKRVSCFGVKMSQLRGGSASGRRFALALLLGWGVLAFGQGSDQQWLVRVGLERQASGKQVFVRAEGGACRWVDIDTGQTVAESPAGKLWRVTSDGDGLRVEAMEAPTRLQGKRLRVEPLGDALMAVGTDSARLKPFRGAMEWQRQGEQLLTINWVRLDDYLKAVLPVEVPARFHMEALKAQAVAARSFTFRRLNRHRDKGYDLCDTEHCQLYGGVQAERPTTNQAVESTAGEVLWHNGRVLEALYCGNCGGHTAPNEQVGGGSVPLEPLRGVLDWDEQAGRFYCDVAPNPRWNLTLTPEELQRAFPDAGKPKRLLIKERALSGHVVRLQLEGERATIEIPGLLFRQRVGLQRIRSLMFTLEPDGNGWRIAGRGSGHGSGLCQWGAQGRALAGQNYRTILQAYYPGTQIQGITPLTERGEPRREGHRGSVEREGGAQDARRAFVSILTRSQVQFRRRGRTSAFGFPSSMEQLSCHSAMSPLRQRMSPEQ